jgi:hypothetical protein
LDDERRRIHRSNMSDQEDFEHWFQMAHDLRSIHGHVLQTSIPYFVPPDKNTLEQIKSINVICIKRNLDWARDYHHFDILTSQWIVSQIVMRLTL